MTNVSSQLGHVILTNTSSYSGTKSLTNAQKFAVFVSTLVKA